MMFVDVAEKQVGQFIGLYEDQVVNFGEGLKFRVVVYAAERAGAICPENNGIAVLRINKGTRRTGPVYTVVASRLAQANSGYYGMTVAQKALFDQLCAADLDNFQALLRTKLQPTY